MTPVEMPKANENLTEATLERWLVREGQAVLKDQALCEIITDKAKFEMPSPDAGIVLKILGEERAMLPVGYVMCVLGAAGEAVPDSFATKNAELLKAHRGAATAVSNPKEAANVAAAAGNAVRATPAARRIAKEHGVDLAAVVAKFSLTAPVGEKDVLKFLGK